MKNLYSLLFVWSMQLKWSVGRSSRPVFSANLARTSLLARSHHQVYAWYLESKPQAFDVISLQLCFQQSAYSWSSEIHQVHLSVQYNAMTSIHVIMWYRRLSKIESFNWQQIRLFVWLWSYPNKNWDHKSDYRLWNNSQAMFIDLSRNWVRNEYQNCSFLLGYCFLTHKTLLFTLYFGINNSNHACDLLWLII